MGHRRRPPSVGPLRDEIQPAFVSPTRPKLNLDVGGSIAEASLVQGVHPVGVTVSLYLRLEAEHSTATELGRQGVPLDVIQKLCGHRKPEEHRGVC